MEVRFDGRHNAEETLLSLIGVLNMFRERYGIEHFSNIQLRVNLQNIDGEEMELVDPVTHEVLDVFEVFTGHPEDIDEDEDVNTEAGVHLVVDNTPKKK